MRMEMITDQNDIFLYFEWIKQTKPVTVLDFGIFLQRIGAVSRQVMNCEIPENIVLDGISINEQVQPVYTKIYNNITNIKSISMLNENVYDLIYFLDMESEYNEDALPSSLIKSNSITEKNSEYNKGTLILSKKELWQWLLNHGKTIIADTKDAEFVQFMVNHAQCQAIHLESIQYALIQGKPIIQNNLSNEQHTSKNVMPMNISAKSSTEMKIKIYIAAHKKFVAPQGIDFGEDMYIPLHVGKLGKTPLGFIGDDTGNHISAKNDTYCELTGMYWIWKNIQCDVVGLCHYRRYFFYNGKILNREDICKLINQYDVIIGNSAMSPYGSVGRHYAAKHHWEDMLVCKDVIKEQCPEYIQAFEQCMDSNFMNIANMMICKKKVFDAYCQWLFDILEEVEKRTDVSGYDTYQKRLYGFLAERLLRVWIMNSKLKVKELQIYLCDDENRQ